MSFLDYAKSELDLIGMTEDSTDEMNLEMRRCILEMVQTFGDQGHSGFSASYALGILKKLLNFEPITPITGADDEWVEVGEGVFQNKRLSRVFKQADRFDGQAYDINGKVFIEHYLDDNGEEYQSSYTGSESCVPITFPYTPHTDYVDKGFVDREPVSTEIHPDDTLTYVDTTRSACEPSDQMPG